MENKIDFNEILKDYALGLTKKHIKDKLAEYYFSTYNVKARNVKEELNSILQDYGCYVDNNCSHLYNIGNNNAWSIKMYETNEVVATLWIIEDIYGGVVHVRIEDLNGIFKVKLQFNSNYVVIKENGEKYTRRFRD